MRTVRHPITMFLMAVLAVIGIGVGVVAGTGNAALSHPTGPLQTPASILALAKLGTEGTFSAVYQLGARRGSSSSSAKNDVTLTVRGVVVPAHDRRRHGPGMGCAREFLGGLHTLALVGATALHRPRTLQGGRLYHHLCARDHPVSPGDGVQLD